ncbi:hypothetical protein D3C72_2512110 [compost metagenome]
MAIDLVAKRETWRSWDGKLYDATEPSLNDVKARFIPYYLWDNRAPGEMLVWLRAQR